MMALLSLQFFITWGLRLKLKSSMGETTTLASTEKKIKEEEVGEEEEEDRGAGES